MKNLKYIFLALAFTIYSCSLEQKFEDSLTTSNSLKSEADVVSFTNGVYQNLQTFTGFKLGSYTFHLMADDIYTRNGSNFNIVYSSKGIVPASNESVNFWARLYTCINNANFLLENVDKTTASAATKTKVKSEMLFLRAFCHFYLVRLWGDVPLKLKATNLNDPIFVNRTPVADVYKQIFEDLENANKGLPIRTVQPAAEVGRATKGAAQAMLAKAYLTFGNYLDLNNKSGESATSYNKAIAWSDSVINSKQYSLIANFNDLFDVNKEVAAFQEIIYGITYTRDPVISGSQSLGSEWGQYNLPSTMPNVGGTGTTKVGQGAFRVQPWIAKKYNTGEFDGDYRSEFGILTSFLAVNGRTTLTYPKVKPTLTGTETVENQAYMGKFKDGAALDGRNAGNDYPVIRYAEIFLIKAEAINELNGPTAEAITLFNNLRVRARNANGTKKTVPLDIKIDGLTKSTFRQKIFDERGLEFIGEGVRYFDLIRMKSPDEKVSMMQYQFETFYPKAVKGLPTYTAATNIWKDADYEPTSVVTWNPKMLLFPIPSTELQANPNLTQNPGF